MEYKIVCIRECPEYLDRSIDYISRQWGLDKEIYRDCIAHSMTTDNPLPRWYLLLKNGVIVGNYSLLTNDFVSRQDLWPYLSALYIDETERGQGWGAALLEHGRKEAFRLGFNRLYLCTDHVNYYEKNGWTCIGKGIHPWNDVSKLYAAEAIQN